MSLSTASAIILLAFAAAASGSSQGYTEIYTFPTPALGAGPVGTPYIGAGGVLYGVTENGGSSTSCGNVTFGCGVAFTITPPTETGGPWTENVLVELSGGSTAPQPLGLVPGTNGTFVGATSEGGTTSKSCPFGCGTLFELIPPSQPGNPWTESVYDLPVMNRNPAGLSSVPGGSVFGANFHGDDPACEYGCGSVYQVQPPSTAGGLLEHQRDFSVPWRR
jgi:hypothetical protein